MPHPLDSFFAPESIALIGASRDHEKIPGRLLAMLRKNEFPGKIYPINPNYDEIDGLACFKSIGEIGAPIGFQSTEWRSSREHRHNVSQWASTFRVSFGTAPLRVVGLAPHCRGLSTALAALRYRASGNRFR